MHAGVGFEARRHKTHTGQVRFVERGGEFAFVEPGRADEFKRSSRAASDRDIGRFEQGDAGVKRSLREAAHVG